MTNPLAEQVAGLEVGDWYKADFLYPDAEVSSKGELKYNSSMEFYIGETFIADDEGNPAPYLTSIIRVPRPIPSEPERLSFGVHRNGFIAQREYELREDGKNWWVQYDFHSWPEIYPHIVRLYTPSGELVTGFEYYKSEGN